MKKKIIFLMVLTMSTSMCMAGCDYFKMNKEGNTQETAKVAEMDLVDSNTVVASIEDEKVPLANINYQVLEPKASGTNVLEGKNSLLDASNTSQGYIMLKYTGKNHKVKVQITKNQGTTYTYNLNKRNSYETYPLTEGDGEYAVKVFENLSGNRYAQIMGKSVSAKMESEFLPFLYPNQYIDFNGNSVTVQKGYEIVGNTKDPIKKVEKIYEYTIHNMTYDTVKAQTVKSGYLPNVDAILAAKKGICFDYAAVMASMLRSQGVPCKLIVGYTGNVYHAWIDVYTPQSGWVDGMIFFDGKQWKLMDPTFASSSKKSGEVMKYIGNAENYKAKYAY